MYKFLLSFYFGLYLIFGLLASGLTMAADEAAKPYSVYIVPQLTPVATHKAWAPVLEKLAAATGLEFELNVEPSIPAFEQAIASGTPDFAYMNPYHIIVAKRDNGYIPCYGIQKTCLKVFWLSKKAVK